MLNRIILIGRLTRDPEAKYTPSGVPVTTFSIAVDRPQSAEARQSGQEKQTDFIDIVAWRQTAEFAANYLQKGRLVAIEGKLQIRAYVTQDGQQRKAAEVVADNVRPLDKPRDGSGEEGGDGYAPPQAAPARGGGNDGGGYERGGNDRGGNDRGNGGGGGGYERGTAAPAPAAARPAAAPARGGRPAPAPQNDEFDDLTDPFAE